MGTTRPRYGIQPTPSGRTTVLTKEDVVRWEGLLLVHHPDQREWAEIFAAFEKDAQTHFVVDGARARISDEEGFVLALTTFASKLAVRYSHCPAVVCAFFQVYWKHKLNLDPAAAILAGAIFQASHGNSHALEKLFRSSLKRCQMPRARP